MLQLKNLRKQYTTGSLVQSALDGVSLDLRPSEFVAILGPSGSGKTTLLNIVGGLDRYDSGDLVIDGVSTEDYSDRDWDNYRNHTVGFVFQSYNLIPHQTVLTNVELALTISGISRAERRRRAQQALEQVGLGAQSHKRPSEMSGGQMQRVAIARALVNDPKIVLADEPTGALDSETSVQVMELLKQVAKDRLVVMVTHNPELAEHYATRIIRLRDGKITDDTDPYTAPTRARVKPKKTKKASMSIFTALMLSFSNLRTKKARTFLTSFAGSIGIIGIAMILALSNGVNAYIKSIESETLAAYPLQLTSTGYDLTSVMSGTLAQMQENAGTTGKVTVQQTVTGMLSGFRANDLSSFKKFLDTGSSGIEAVTTAVEYCYNVTPQIYRAENGGFRQVHPDQTLSAMGFGAESSSSMFSSMMSFNVFNAMPAEPSLYREQYDVKAGHWPENYNECVVVLSPAGSISDFTMYTLGLRDAMELDELIRRFLNNEDVGSAEVFDKYEYEELLDIEFRLLDVTELYEYDEDYALWRDRSQDESARNAALESAETLKIVGVVQPKEDASTMLLTAGIGYPAELTTHVAKQAAKSEIVQAQLASPKVNVFTGKEFEDKTQSALDLSTLFSVDTDALKNAFSVDEGALNLDFSGMFEGLEDSLNLGDSLEGAFDGLTMPELPMPDLAEILSQIQVDIHTENFGEAMRVLVNAYRAYAAEHPEADYTRLGEYFKEYLSSEEGSALLQAELGKILEENGALSFDLQALSELMVELLEGYRAYAEENGVTDPAQFAETLRDYLQTPEAQEILSEGAQKLIDFGEGVRILPEQLGAMLDEIYAGYRAYATAHGLADPEKFSERFAEFLQDAAAQEAFSEAARLLLDVDALSAQLTQAVQGYFNEVMQTVSQSLAEQIAEKMGQASGELVAQLSSELATRMQEQMGQLVGQFAGALRVDSEAMMGAFRLSMDESSLASLLSSLTQTGDNTYESNLKSLGYADFDDPSEIRIYPVDFAAKGEIVRILDEYNEKMQSLGEEDKVIGYTDMVGTMMSSVTQIVDIIGYVLIAFVAISLVVSSIMIGVITYISVMERRKEIGILRAIGASKRNISEVFNAETFLVGLLAGLIGIGLTLLMLIPANAIIQSLTGEPNLRAVLPADSAALLVLLSIALTLIGGLIPAKSAARSDPVAALRSE